MLHEARERCCPVSQTQVIRRVDTLAAAWRLSRLASPIFHRAEIRRQSGAASASGPRRKDPTPPSLHRAHKQTSTDTVVMRDARRRREPCALPPCNAHGQHGLHARALRTPPIIRQAQAAAAMHRRRLSSAGHAYEREASANKAAGARAAGADGLSTTADGQRNRPDRRAASRAHASLA